MTSPFSWSPTPHGVRGSGPAHTMALISSMRDGSYSWEFSSLRADDDKRGRATTIESAKYACDRAYEAWRVGLVHR